MVVREGAKMKSIIALQKNIGWKHIQMDHVSKLQKKWVCEGKEYRVDAYFGTLRDGRFSPAIVMNVYEQGAGAKMVVDENCDVWKNSFEVVTKIDGNDFYKLLTKHGFGRVRE
jgi:hypothetical protein